MPTAVAWIGMAVAATTLAGCRSDARTVPVAAPPSVAPASSPASNGIEAMDADEILQRARAALREAKTYRANGTLNLDGEKTAIDLTVSGRNFVGSLSFGEARVDLLATGGKRYLRPNKQFWIMSTGAREGALLAQAMGDRWVTGVDRDPSFADLFAIGTLDGLLRAEDQLGIGAVKEVAGVRAVGLMDFGDIEKKLFVASTGKPYPLQLTGTGGAEVAFSDFGAPVTGLEAPAASKVVDLGELAR